MKVSERSFGALISPYDIRDYKLATCVTAQEFPETFILPEVSVKDQGSTGSCVAHACSTIVEYFNQKQEETDTVFSTEFIYGYRPEGYYIGSGMYLRDALKTIQKLGDCPLESLKGNHEYEEAMSIVNAVIEDLKPEAYPHRISTYARVYGVDGIKQALMDHGYVLVCMPWHVDYKLVNGVYNYTSDAIRGYHAVVIYGWDERGWLVHNSWGKSWGQKGKFVVPFEFKWKESWVITDCITSKEDDKKEDDNTPDNDDTRKDDGTPKDDDIIKPEEDNWFIKFFGKIINFFVNLFKKKQ